MVATCTNCGASLTGAYCGQCGQSTADLNRPVHALARDFFDGFFSLDERFWKTIFGLFKTPGLATRDFLGGRRASFTPPVRLYVISALLFVVGFQLSGITPMGLTTGARSDLQLSQSEVLVGVSAGETDIFLTLFRPPWEAGPQPLDWDQVRATIIDLGDSGEEIGPPLPETEEEALARGGFLALAVRVARDPANVERQANMALNQAVLVMVLIFAVLNMLLHPKARLITHVIHSLYIHATALPVILVSAMASVYAHAIHIIPGTTLGILGFFGVLYLVWLADQTVYASSWWGAALRVLTLLMLYATSFAFVAVGLIFLVVM